MENAQLDLQIFDAFRTDSRYAIDLVLVHYGNRIRRAASRMANRNRYLAAEIEQEVLIKLFLSGTTYSPHKGRFVAWLSQVIRSMAGAVYRRRKRSRKNVITLTSEMQATLQTTPNGNSELASDAALVMAAINNLPEKTREVVNRHYFDGERVVDIAESMAIPAGTVKSRLHTARQCLRTRLTRCDPLQ